MTSSTVHYRTCPLCEAMCGLEVHVEADQVRLIRADRAEAGAVDVAVEVTDEMMRGVVSLPHGWGHDLEGVQLSVAREHAGINNNLLAPGTLVDAISGNAIVNGIPVEVVPA